MERAYDLVIRGGRVFDGNGGDAFEADIAVKDGSVALQAGSTPAGTDFFRGNLSGTFKNSIDTMAIQAHITF